MEKAEGTQGNFCVEIRRLIGKINRLIIRCYRTKHGSYFLAEFAPFRGGTLIA